MKLERPSDAPADGHLEALAQRDQVVAQAVLARNPGPHRLGRLQIDRRRGAALFSPGHQEAVSGDRAEVGGRLGR